MGDRSTFEGQQSDLYRSMLERIISGEFAAGERLVEEELARTYNVSRTPIREVLFALEKDGLVERVRNQGARVAAFSPDDVEEIFDIRNALECHALSKAIRTIKLSELMELERQLIPLIGQETPAARDRLAQIDMRFHKLVVEGSGNRRLIDYVDRISLLVESLQLTGYRRESYIHEAAEEHLSIIRALLNRDLSLIHI